MGKKNSRAQVAVLGAGYWGKNLVRDFYALGALKVVYDPDSGVRARISEEFPGVRVTGEPEEVYRDDEVRAVAIASPAATHGAMAMEAIGYGRDVFVEKPLALKVEDGELVVEAARREGRILMVDHLLNRHPALVELKKMVKEGRLGRILRVWSRRHNFGKLRKDENVSWSFAPHDVSMILGLIDQGIVSVEATGACYLTDGVEDIVEGHLAFEDGATAQLSVSWLNPYKEQKLAVIGTKKMAVFDDTAGWEGKLVVYDHKIDWKNQTPTAIKDEAGVKIPFEPLESLKEQCRIFLECVEKRTNPPDSDGTEALAVMKVLLALDQALKKDAGMGLGALGKGAGPKGPKSPIGPEGHKGFTGRSGEARIGLTAQRERGRHFGFGDEVAEIGVPVEDGSGYFVHGTASVEAGAKIGSGVKIWHFSRVLADSEIGPGTSLGQNVVIGPGAKVGAGCKIQNNVSVYKGVTLEDMVFCGPSMVFTNVINPRAFIPRMDELRPTLVKFGATIGANATVVCGHTLGRFCLVGAGAVVAGDVLDYALMVGVPARRVGWICRCGARLKENGFCLECGRAYEYARERLVEIPSDDLVD
ncbi:MAG: Gfo/Idh/MocA family oxidoreductase [Deltaproteobacteria bacterium]|jgi:UDP-2-acetamido-3-amino-2,3-dideoxy-glucuronate N-acetyltransferase|nr:Gfo/Idh/MocA family oxidoreductase [Deltaproteobacteria bacterium]